MDHEYKRHPVVTATWVDGRVVPIAESSAGTETVWFALPRETGSNVQVWEGLASEATEVTDRLRLRAVPLFAYDVNYGDEVSVMPSGEGALVATGITADAGNYTFRVWMPEDADDAAFRGVVEQFGLLGCLIEGYSDRLVGFSCAPEIAQDVAAALQWAEDEGRLLYETGRQRTS